MSKFFLRPENWLLIIPLILLGIKKIFFSATVIDLHFHDTYFIVSGLHISIGILIILLVPYLCHTLLRLQHKRHKAVLATHVVSTILLVLFLYIPVQQNADAPQRYYDFSSWESSQQFGGLSYYLTIAVLAFISIQLVFILYTITRLVIKNGFTQTTSLK
jgi:cytochrome c oxidase subunit I